MNELRSQRYWRNRPPEERLINTEIPKRYRKDTLDSFKWPAKDADTKSLVTRWVENAEEMCEQGQGLYICGGTGSGKTHIAQAILKRVVYTKNLSGMFVTAEGYIQMADNKRDFKDDYPDGYEDPNTMKYLQEVFDIVVVDSLGIERDTEYSRRTITTLLQSRYHNQLPTIITSVLKPAQLESVYNASIASLVHDCCLVAPLKGSDYRITKWVEENAG